MPAPVVEFRRVHRRFGQVEAVRDLSFSIGPGTVGVLLGPNGAGKTTSLRMITGALALSQGELRVFELDPAAAGEEVRRRCGVAPPKPALYERLTGRENLVYSARLHGVKDASALGLAASRFGIQAALDQRVGGYSTGMRTRLALARAILHDPELLLLDEPTAGLDPESARAVLAFIREFADNGGTVVLCTHLLHEAEGIADHVVLIDQGTARAAGHPHQLANRYSAHPAVVFDAEDRNSLAMLARAPGVLSHSWENGVRVELDALSRVPDLVAWLGSQGVRLTRVQPQAVTLESLYFEIQRSHREAA